MSVASASFPPDIEVVPVAVVVPALKALLITTIFSSFLVPTAIILFVSSTPAIRKRPSFILNVCAIALGLTQGAVNAYVTISELVNTTPRAPLMSTMIGLYIVVPLCVQIILLLRVLAVYPPRQLSRPLCLGMYGPIVAMKAARIANACYLIYTIQRNKNEALTPWASEAAAAWASPFAKSESFLQLVDDVCVSALFLLRLQVGIQLSGRQSRTSRSHALAPQESYRNPGARLRTLFWIALSNFVFPVIFDVAQLVLIFRDPNYVHGTYVVSSNSYISILGVLFSTIWASGSHRTGEASGAESSVGSRTNTHSTSIIGHFAAPPKSLSGPYASRTLSPQWKPLGLSSSRSELDALSGEGESAEEHRR